VARLEFAFQEFVKEIDLISALASKYITPDSIHILTQLKNQLEGIRGARSGTPFDWGISAESPLRTRTSRGSYEREGRGSHHVLAKISSIWTIEPLGGHGPKYSRQRKFALAGKASTRVRLFEESQSGGQQEIAMWRMEVADSTSPGCFFHVQVLGDTGLPPFPDYLPVPRFPGFLPTPPVVLEFVLGELFQDEWARHASEENATTQPWRTMQASRLMRFLRWQQQRLASCSGSPWVALKLLQPAGDLFIKP